MKGLTQDAARLRRLWDEHIHRPFPSGGDDRRAQEVALYSSWLGAIVEVAASRGELEPHHAVLLKARRQEGNQEVFRAAGDLGEPFRSYVARLLAIEDLLIELPVSKRNSDPPRSGEGGRWPGGG